MDRTDFRGSLAPLFAPDERMRMLVQPKHGLTDVRPMFPYVLGGYEEPEEP